MVAVPFGDGSLRQRGPDTWELRVYLGVDCDSGRERWATKTVHGSRRHAAADLASSSKTPDMPDSASGQWLIFLIGG